MSTPIMYFVCLSLSCKWYLSDSNYNSVIQCNLANVLGYIKYKMIYLLVSGNVM